MPRHKPKPDRAWFSARMEDCGLSQRGLANALDIDHSSLVYMLDGARKLQIQEAIDLARILRVPLRDVLRRTGYSLAGIEL